ncbi:MAG: hypothetical protein HY898_35325 [Deltaproteobacteria bacterium]|nr:hypothetical protein [Deltaproteobacteria bacterium]
MTKRRTVKTRDQDWSTFAQILQNLIEATPGALGAVLVDCLGEAVDYAGVIEAFDIKVAGAHIQLEFRKANEGLAAAFGPVRQLTVRASSRSYVARDLADGYMVVVVMGRCAGFGISPRAIAQAEWDLRTEAGWAIPAGEERWVHARVEANPADRRRPKRVYLEDAWHEVQVIGSLVGLGRGERGYRVRTDSGAEITLVRERLGKWFADTVLEEAKRSTINTGKPSS